MPQNNIRIIDGAIGSGGFNPRRNTVRWLAGCLWNMAASGMDFIVGVCRILLVHGIQRRLGKESYIL